MDDLKAKNDLHEDLTIAFMDEYPDVFTGDRRRETVRRILGDASDFDPGQLRLMVAKAAADIRGQRLAGTDAASVLRRAYAERDEARKDEETARAELAEFGQLSAEAEIRRKAADAKAESERVEAEAAGARGWLTPLRADLARPSAAHAGDPGAVGLRFHGSPRR